jgi:hypothetical protein
MLRSVRLALTAALVVPGLALVAPPATAAPAAPATGAFDTTVDDVVVDLRPGTAESAVATEDDVQPFTMIGATYTSASDRPGRVRALVDGTWTRWFPLVETEADGDHGPDAATGEGDRPASDPVWVGAGEAFELRLPADVDRATVHLVRDTEIAGGEAAPEAASPEAYAIPSVRPRADWNAGPYHGTVAVADGLQRAVIHHTVNGNGYSAAQVPSMLRSIQAYHQDSRGWDDIGYNFVLDRFGTVWEARARSLYEPVIGAHARDHNEGSVGVAYLGDGTSAGLTSTAVTNLSRFLGWKMSLHGARPTRANIVGHRDVGQTTCPGGRIYGQLPQIRTKAIQLAPPRGPFFDVPNGSARAPYLQWARSAKVIDRLRDGTFHPERRVTRADAVFWLWHLARSPTATSGHGFSDVPANAYYRNALRWAREQRIVRMTSDGKFHPSSALTREAWVLQLWRWVGSPNPSVPNDYTDVPDGISSEVALDWADAYKLVNTPAFGRSTRLDRGQTVQLLYRLRRFDDVPKRHFAHDAISWARYHVIATGYPGNEFRPGAGVTRSQGLVWIWRTMDRPDQPHPPDDGFTDDDEGAWYAAALDWADDAGWVGPNGGTGTDFAPDGVLHRGDAVAWAWHIAGSTASANTNTFTDVPPDLDDAVDWADGYGIASGFDDNTFRPNDPVTRAQFLRMLNQLANRPGAWSVDPPTTVEF